MGEHQAWIKTPITYVCNHKISMTIEEDVARDERKWYTEERRRDERRGGGQKDEMISEPPWVNIWYSHALLWEAGSLRRRWLLTWLCMNLRLIPSSVTCSSPPSPVFMSWTGNSPPSSGPEGRPQGREWVNSFIGFPPVYYSTPLFGSVGPLTCALSGFFCSPWAKRSCAVLSITSLLLL